MCQCMHHCGHNTTGAERPTKGEDGSLRDPPGRSAQAGLGLAFGLEAALENADN